MFPGVRHVVALTLLAAVTGVRPPARAGDIDFARSRHRAAWLSHPVLGEPSWDSLVRSPASPIYRGAPPWEWPVNGFLLRDPGTNQWYAHISLYPRGYWPAGPSRLLRSGDEGRTWTDLGLALRGDKDSFDGDGRQGGATLDATAVIAPDGCHVVYGWAKPDNSDGGIAYAWGPTAAGPFTRDPTPIHAESRQPVLGPGYKRVYAATLVRRRHDWLIVADMSTPGNAGGRWALVGMTAPAARGPYTAPAFLRAPHGEEWFPQPIEFATAFVHGDRVYAPLTSVAANRGWQMLLRARIEDAHRPEAWEVFQAGSLWHWEGDPTEAKGIWGQTFTGFVDPGGHLQLMYPARDANDVGTIHLASRPWREPLSDGFHVSAPVAPSLALLQREYEDFELTVEARATGAWSLFWDHRAPLTSDRLHADGRIAPVSLRELTALRLTSRDWRIEAIDAAGRTNRISSGRANVVPDHLRLVRRGAELLLGLGEPDLVALNVPAGRGAVGVLAEPGCAVHVTRFAMRSAGDHGSFFSLAEDGLLGAGWTAENWKPARDGFRHAHGFTGSFPEARAKWSLVGRRFRLWSPRGPDWGDAEVLLDGRVKARLTLRAPARTPSAVVWDSGSLRAGPHVVTLRRVSGDLPVDAVEVLVP